MALGHYKGVAAYSRGASSDDAAVDYHMLAYHIVVSDIAECAFAFPAEVLRVGADDGTLVHLVVRSHSGAAHNAGVGHDFASGADFYVFVDVGESMDGYVLGYFGRRVDVGKFAYHIRWLRFRLTSASESLIEVHYGLRLCQTA